jgi:hypothetical protein
MSLGRFHLIADFEMPIENIKDVVNWTYHHSWMRERDDWIWDKTVHYRDADVALLQKFIENFK